MDGGSSLSSSSSFSSSSSSTSTSPESITLTQRVEIIGPKKFVALGGNNLTIRYRLSSLLYSNLTTPFASLLLLSFQLMGPQDDGAVNLIASQDISSSSLHFTWEEVRKKKENLPKLNCTNTSIHILHPVTCHKFFSFSPLMWPCPGKS